eukprot:ctg_2650.g545
MRPTALRQWRALWAGAQGCAMACTKSAPLPAVQSPLHHHRPHRQPKPRLPTPSSPPPPPPHTPREDIQSDCGTVHRTGGIVQHARHTGVLHTHTHACVGAWSTSTRRCSFAPARKERRLRFGSAFPVGAWTSRCSHPSPSPSLPCHGRGRIPAAIGCGQGALPAGLSGAHPAAQALVGGAAGVPRQHAGDAVATAPAYAARRRLSGVGEVRRCAVPAVRHRAGGVVAGSPVGRVRGGAVSGAHHARRLVARGHAAGWRAGAQPAHRPDYRVRLDAIERYATFPRSLHPATAGCLRIRCKDVYEKGELPLLFSRIQQRHVVAADDDDDDDCGGGGIGEYRYEHLRADGVLSNGNDGLVFTPVKLPYTLRTCTALLKYKYPTHHTVDFTLWLEGDSGGHDVHTFLGYRSENGITRYREVYFPTRRKRAWFADYSQWHECIIECTYDRQAGEWRYLRRRTDKESPNYASVVMDCLEAIAESIPCEELLQRVTDGSPAPCASADKTAPGRDLFDAANADYTRSTPMSPYPPPVQSAVPP